MAEPVKYVPFGGAQVPEGTRREVIDRNGQKIYCVWTDDKGGKVTYPEQTYQKSNIIEYTRTDFYPTGYTGLGGFRPRTYNISKSEFDNLCKYGDRVRSFREYTIGIIKGQTLDGTELDVGKFECDTLDGTPKIDVSTDSGMIYDTQNVTLSNMRGATVTGSTDEDNVTLMNSSNCTVDVSNANNNMFVSDNVRVVNGQGNKVKAGDHDHVTFGTHNYETNTDTTKANHKGEGTYRQ